MSSLLKDILRQLRTNQNYTQKQVADYLNMTRQGYAHYEAGLRNPDYQTLLKLSELYQVNIGDLINITTTPINHTTIMYEDSNYLAKSTSASGKGLSNKNHTTTFDEKKLLYLYQKLSSSDKKELLYYLEQKVNKKNHRS